MRLLILLALFGYSASVQSQTFRASLLAGTNFSQVDGDDLLGFHQLGFNGGARVVAVLSDHWRIGPELLYSQEGAHRNANSTTGGTLDRIRFHTVSLPVMAYYHDWRLAAGLGVGYQRLIDYRFVTISGRDVTADQQLRDQAFVLHLGVTLQLSSHWGVNFRWSRNLTDLREGPGDRLVSRSLTLRAVYRLGRQEVPRKQPTNQPLRE